MVYRLAHQQQKSGSEWSHGARTRAFDALVPASGARTGHGGERRKACLSGRKSPHSRHRKNKNITYRSNRATRKNKYKPIGGQKEKKNAEPRLRSKKKKRACNSANRRKRGKGEEARRLRKTGVVRRAPRWPTRRATARRAGRTTGRQQVAIAMVVVEMSTCSSHTATKIVVKLRNSVESVLNSISEASTICTVLWSKQRSRRQTHDGLVQGRQRAAGNDYRLRGVDGGPVCGNHEG